MTHGDLQEEVDRLAEELGRSVAIDDPRLLLIVASRHFGDEDRLRVHSILNRSVPDEAREHVMAYGLASWWNPGRIPGDARLGYTERLCIPLRHGSDLLGFCG